MHHVDLVCPDAIPKAGGVRGFVEALEFSREARHRLIKILGGFMEPLTLQGSPMKDINTVHAAKVVFGGGSVTPELTYLGAQIETDFELSYENLAPYVRQVLDLASLVEAVGFVQSVKIKNGVVEVI